MSEHIKRIENRHYINLTLHILNASYFYIVPAVHRLNPNLLDNKAGFRIVLPALDLKKIKLKLLRKATEELLYSQLKWNFKFFCQCAVVSGD